MKTGFAIALAVVFTTCLFAADKPAGDALSRWVGGKWVGDGQFVDSAYSKAAKVGGVTTCAWSPNHVFLVCDQDVTFAGTPMRDLSIYVFDPKANTFHFYQVTPEGAQPHVTSLDISDDATKWIYLGSAEREGKKVLFRTTNQFHGNDQVDWWSEASGDDGKTWTKTASGTESRQP
jgi:hypothetical protein